jgi:cytochrome b561
MQARYGRTARVLHWLIGTLLLAQFAFGWWLTGIPRNTPDRGTFVNFHKSTGIILGLLILFRLYWRFRHAAPRFPATLALWQQRAASVNHLLLYVCMVVMPLSGYIASNFSRFGVKFFNVILFPPWGPDNKVVYGVLNQIHKTTALILGAVLVAHVLAAIWHGLHRDGIFNRIWLRPF